MERAPQEQPGSKARARSDALVASAHQFFETHGLRLQKRFTDVVRESSSEPEPPLASPREIPPSARRTLRVSARATSPHFPSLSNFRARARGNRRPQGDGRPAQSRLGGIKGQGSLAKDPTASFDLEDCVDSSSHPQPPQNGLECLASVRRPALSNSDSGPYDWKNKTPRCLPPFFPVWPLPCRLW